MLSESLFRKIRLAGQISGTVACLTLGAATCIGAAADKKEAAPDALRMPFVFCDHLVLQRSQPIPVWGWAKPGAKVKAELDGKSAEATADAKGKWMVRLPERKEGGPYELTISDGATKKTLSDVMVGDVWLCSGQSNMWWRVKQSKDAAAEIAAAKYPNLRLFQVHTTAAPYPQDDVTTGRQWLQCEPENVADFSATAYFFGRDLQKSVDVPIGLIETCVGGTPAESWTSLEVLKTVPGYDEDAREYEEDHKDLDAAKARYEKALAAYNKESLKKDPGAEPSITPWYDPQTTATEWTQFKLPAMWPGELKPADGSVWLRHTVDVSAEQAGKPAVLDLGRVDDGAIAWINGKEVGKGFGAHLEQSYKIPEGILKAGKNLVVVRVLDIGGPGGFRDKAEGLKLRFGAGDSAESVVSLAGDWELKAGAPLNTLPAVPRDTVGGRGITKLYNAMIAPLIPYGIRGAIWYQGESNAGRAYEYRTLFASMIKDWRTRWNKDFPFLFVQLAGYVKSTPEPSDHPWAELREAQAMTLKLPATGMATAIDIGDEGDIHPANKQDVGKRLALAARRISYGEDIEDSGPTYKSMDIDGSKAILTFDHAKGMAVRDGQEAKSFAIAGEDKKFVWAKAEVKGDKIIVQAPEVTKPVAVRYAWSSCPEMNIFNAAGLPVYPFRTDKWPGVTEPKKGAGK